MSRTAAAASEAIKRAPGERQFVVVSESMIIDVLGMCQLLEEQGISLSRLQIVLDRVRGGKDRVDWYRLRDSLSALENRGMLVSGASKPKRGVQRHAVWSLADWGSWWQAQTRMT